MGGSSLDTLIPSTETNAIKGKNERIIQIKLISVKTNIVKKILASDK
jgi:hypothetical protein